MTLLLLAACGQTPSDSGPADTDVPTNLRDRAFVVSEESDELFVFDHASLAAIGSVDLAESETTTIIAAAMALIWFVAFVARRRTGALRVQRADRERRGY